MDLRRQDMGRVSGFIALHCLGTFLYLLWLEKIMATRGQRLGLSLVGFTEWV